jgi:hypothetical protein
VASDGGTGAKLLTLNLEEEKARPNFGGRSGFWKHVTN